MKKKFLLVSAFGRGHWLAVQLKRMGLQVVLMDVTEKLGAWIPEEAEGPFGFFYSDRILDSQMERLYEDDALSEGQNGFQLWLQNGPVELKGPTTAHRLWKLGIPDSVMNSILTGSGIEKLKTLGFAEKWLALFAHQYAANEFYATMESLQIRQFLPLMSTFHTRFASRRGHEKSLQWIERQEIEVLRQADILDISMLSRSLMKGIEYKTAQTESSQIYEGDFTVWSLTSEETKMLGVKPFQVLYAKGGLEPVWYWARFRFRFSEGPVRESLPTHSVLIGDLGISWTHENMMVLQRTGSRELFDIWVRLPHVQRFNKDYLDERGARVLQQLREKLVATEIQIVDEPIGYEQPYAQAGPPRHPLFDPRDLRNWQTSRIQNLYFDSAEQWSMLGLNGMFEHQIQLHHKILQWWEALIAKQTKQTKQKREIEL